MTPYALVLCIVVACSLCSIISTNPRRFVLFAALTLILFAGLRSDIGWDYEVYQAFYNSMMDANLRDAFTSGDIADSLGFEPGFTLLIWLTAHFDLNYQLICAVLTILLVFYAASQIGDKHSIPIFIILYLWYGYFHNFTIIRQGLASAIAFWAIASMSKPIRATGSTIAASLVHKSSVFLLPMIFVCIRFLGHRALLAALCFAWILTLTRLGDPIATMLSTNFGPSKWETLSDDGALNYKVGFSLILIEYTIVTVALLGLPNNEPSIRFARGIVIARLLLYGIFNDVTIAWERTSTFSDPMYAMALAIIISKLANHFMKNRLQSQVFTLLVILVATVYVGVKYDRMLASEARIVSERSHADRFIPYKSIFDPDRVS